MTENEKINEIIKRFADGDFNINSFANKIYRLGFEDGKSETSKSSTGAREPILTRLTEQQKKFKR